MATFTKTVTVSFETPSVSSAMSEAMQRMGDRYLREALAKITPLVRVLSIRYTNILNEILSVRGKTYTVYTLTYKVDVSAPATDIATQAIENTMVVNQRKKANERFFLVARKAV